VQTLPALSDLASGKVTVRDFRELDVEDLLGRAPVPPNPELLARNLAAKVVLVGGAGGSIGSELCRQILAERPRQLLLLEQNEFALYSVHQELLRLCAEEATTRLVPLLGSVYNHRRISDILRTYRPDTVYHAAAYKHVPLVEHNPAEGVLNNVFGTLNLVRAAMEAEVASFVLISTDKAVRPTNVMGASKRVAEQILQALSACERPSFHDVESGCDVVVANRTRLSMVRFGNVLGSSGSVVPLFRQQIAAGGPITVTDVQVTRYFMTIPEAAQLVLQAGAMAKGGDVFVLDMGQPVKIIDLARRMVELSGLTVRDAARPNGDLEIVTTGLRPGEKLYEELLIGESPTASAHPRILTAQEPFAPWPELSAALRQLRTASLGNDVATLFKLLRVLVPGATFAAEIQDYVTVDAAAEAA
ncbi:MAG: nucleoside-diphosphate sugar epimerase/dehydratase, partial [Burkholderiales bacterium]